MLRCAHRSLRRLIHPRSVKVVKLDGKPVDEDTFKYRLRLFPVLHGGVLGPACLVGVPDGFSLTTSFTATFGLPVQHRSWSGSGGPHGELLRLLGP